MKGLILNIFRTTVRGRTMDCTNGGISSKHDEVLLVGPGIDEVFDATTERPRVCIKVNPYGTVSLVPAGEDGKPLPGWWMMGGNFAACSDSRVSKAISKALNQRTANGTPAMFYGAVAMHDRQE